METLAFAQPGDLLNLDRKFRSYESDAISDFHKHRAALTGTFPGSNLEPISDC